jgi:conjugative transposon protein TcpC
VRTLAGLGSVSARELLARVGRWVLWLAVVAVLARGGSDMLGRERSRTTTPLRHVATAVRWPDDAARAFAVAFASAYLTLSPGDNGAHARQLTAFASPALADQLVPRLPRRPAGQAVRSATVAKVARVDHGHALVTVAATVAHDGLSSRFLTVPVARDAAGGLVVYDLPSFVLTPARATAGPPPGDPFTGADRAAIADVVTRFLRAYLAGDAGALTYLVVPGTHVGAAGDFELVTLTSLASERATAGDRRTVLATVQARDVESRATYALRYRVELVRRERWYVAAINASGKE